MEKHSPLFYVGIFLYLFLAIFSFSIAAINISDFIRSGAVSFLKIYAASALCAVAFMVSYFVINFGWPTITTLYLAKPELYKSIWLNFGIVIFWWILQLVLMLSDLYLTSDHPVKPLLQAVISYNFAGMMFAWASIRINAMRKV